MNILFICSGNTCRSPMAEVCALDMMRREGGFEHAAVASAGMAAHLGDMAMPGAQRAAAAHGLDLSHHRSQALTTDMMDASDFIYTMTHGQALQLKRILPQYEDKVQALCEDDVMDPYGQSDDVYNQTYQQIEAGIQAHLPQWKDKKGE